MLTAFAHFILACTRSRSLIADSMRDEPERWMHDGRFRLTHNRSGLCVRILCGTVTVYINDNDYLGRDLRWAEGSLVKRAAKTIVARGKAQAVRQFDKALKAALTGDE